MSAFRGCGSAQSMSAALREIAPTATRLPRLPRASVSARAWRTAAAAFGLRATAVVGSGDWAAGRVDRRRIAARKRFMRSMLGYSPVGFKRSRLAWPPTHDLAGQRPRPRDVGSFRFVGNAGFRGGADDPADVRRTRALARTNVDAVGAAWTISEAWCRPGRSKSCGQIHLMDLRCVGVDIECWHSVCGVILERDSEVLVDL